MPCVVCGDKRKTRKCGSCGSTFCATHVDHDCPEEEETSEARKLERVRELAAASGLGAPSRDGDRRPGPCAPDRERHSGAQLPRVIEEADQYRQNVGQGLEGWRRETDPRWLRGARADLDEQPREQCQMAQEGGEPISWNNPKRIASELEWLKSAPHLGGSAAAPPRSVTSNFVPPKVHPGVEAAGKVDVLNESDPWRGQELGKVTTKPPGRDWRSGPAGKVDAWSRWEEGHPVTSGPPMSYGPTARGGGEPAQGSAPMGD